MTCRMRSPSSSWSRLAPNAVKRKPTTLIALLHLHVLCGGAIWRDLHTSGELCGVVLQCDAHALSSGGDTLQGVASLCIGRGGERGAIGRRERDGGALERGAARCVAHHAGDAAWLLHGERDVRGGLRSGDADRCRLCAGEVCGRGLQVVCAGAKGAEREGTRGAGEARVAKVREAIVTRAALGAKVGDFERVGGDGRAARQITCPEMNPP